MPDQQYQIPKRVSLRCTVPASISGQRYRITHSQLAWLVNRLCQNGMKSEQLLVDESAPDHRVTLHAEVMRSYRYLEVRYSLFSAGMGMRQCFDPEQPNGVMRHAWGISAINLLKQFLDYESMDNLNRIFCGYPDDTVELSAYSCPVGELYWNTLFWEVRSY